MILIYSPVYGVPSLFDFWICGNNILIYSLCNIYPANFLPYLSLFSTTKMVAKSYTTLVYVEFVTICFIQPKCESTKRFVEVRFIVLLSSLKIFSSRILIYNSPQ